MKQNRWRGPRPVKVMNQRVPHVADASATACSYVSATWRDVVVEVRTPRGLLSVVTVRVPR